MWFWHLAWIKFMVMFRWSVFFAIRFHCYKWYCSFLINWSWPLIRWSALLTRLGFICFHIHIHHAIEPLVSIAVCPYNSYKTLQPQRLYLETNCGRITIRQFDLSGFNVTELYSSGATVVGFLNLIFPFQKKKKSFMLIPLNFLIFKIPTPYFLNQVSSIDYFFTFFTFFFSFF